MPDELNNLPAPRDDAPEETTEPRSDELDAANASLANALSMSFTLLRVVMVALIVVFLFSGFFTVQQNEVAVRTRFGKIIPDAGGSEVLTAEGGPYFRWPAPIGEVYRIPTSRRTVYLDTSFVFQTAAEQPGTAINDLNDAGMLDPEADGSLLTADKNIVHARYSVTYQVAPEQAAQFVRNVASVAALERGIDNRDEIFADADVLVRRVVEQAVVADVAATPLDRFLLGGRGQPTEGQAATQQPAATQPADTELAQPPVTDADDRAISPTGAEPAGGSSTPRALDQDSIRLSAQQVLSEMNTGITLIEVLRTDQGVPSNVRGAFEQVTAAYQLRGELVSEAESESGSIFRSRAGGGYRAVLAVIDIYEEAGRVREANPEFYAAAEAALRDVYDGKPLGEVLTGLVAALPANHPQRDNLSSLAERHADDRLGGLAATIVNTAGSRAAEYIAQLESDARQFETLLASYREKPELVKLSLFNKMLRNVLSGETVETEFVAPGSRLRLNLNRDAELRRAQEQRSREQRANEQRGQQSGR